MNVGGVQAPRCVEQTVEVARLEKLLRDSSPAALARLFTRTELQDAEAPAGPGRGPSLAACLAAKEAGCKLFPREAAGGLVTPADFSVRREDSGPTLAFGPPAEYAFNRHRLDRPQLRLTYASTAASAAIRAEFKETVVPWYGKAFYRLLPLRRGVVLSNLRRVFGDVLPEAEICRLAQAFYGHFLRFLSEFVYVPRPPSGKGTGPVRVENMQSPLRAHERGKGLLLLTGHFGNWEVATVAGIRQFPQYSGLFHFVRRLLKPRLLNDFVTWRFRRAGFVTLSKRGSLDAIYDVLGRGGILVYVFDQHAHGREGVAVDFLGHPANSFKSLAILAMDTGAPVIPAASWREPDGSHVLRFEEPLPLIEHDDVDEAIRQNTRAYNQALERMLVRHPEQWIWMHRRWKVAT